MKFAQVKLEDEYQAKRDEYLLQKFNLSNGMR